MAMRSEPKRKAAAKAAAAAAKAAGRAARKVGLPVGEDYTREEAARQAPQVKGCCVIKDTTQHTRWVCS